MKTQTIYICDRCGVEFGDEASCRRHEGECQHIHVQLARICFGTSGYDDGIYVKQWVVDGEEMKSLKLGEVSCSTWGRLTQWTLDCLPDQVDKYMGKFLVAVHGALSESRDKAARALDALTGSEEWKRHNGRRRGKAPAPASDPGGAQWYTLVFAGDDEDEPPLVVQYFTDKGDLSGDIRATVLNMLAGDFAGTELDAVREAMRSMHVTYEICGNVSGIRLP